MFSLRSPVSVILLTFVTCGIYGFFWLYQTSKELQLFLDNDNNPSLDVILSIVTFGLYQIYLMYRNANQLVEFQKRFNLYENDVRLLNVVCCALGLSPIAYGITQDVMNRCSVELRSRQTGNVMPNENFM